MHLPIYQIANKQQNNKKWLFWINQRLICLKCIIIREVKIYIRNPWPLISDNVNKYLTKLEVSKEKKWEKTNQTLKTRKASLGYMPIIQTFQRQRQVNSEVDTILSETEWSCFRPDASPNKNVQNFKVNVD